MLSSETFIALFYIARNLTATVQNSATGPGSRTIGGEGVENVKKLFGYKATIAVALSVAKL